MARAFTDAVLRYTFTLPDRVRLRGAHNWLSQAHHESERRCCVGVGCPSDPAIAENEIQRARQRHRYAAVAGLLRHHSGSVRPNRRNHRRVTKTVELLIDSRLRPSGRSSAPGRNKASRFPNLSKMHCGSFWSKKTFLDQAAPP